MNANPEGTDIEVDVDAGNAADRPAQTLAERIRMRFAALGGVDLAQEAREALRPAPEFEPGG